MIIPVGKVVPMMCGMIPPLAVVLPVVAPALKLTIIPILLVVPVVVVPDLVIVLPMIPLAIARRGMPPATPAPTKMNPPRPMWTTNPLMKLI
jgi:hypothetical protein